MNIANEYHYLSITKENEHEEKSIWSSLCSFNAVHFRCLQYLRRREQGLGAGSFHFYYG
ncbi:hypothetical protein [Priestia megaterium]|uniref:hypothetical protein n=1 Tax=Priestia megaterium TaxID=1404 RepID=UPI002E23D993|nr:hypothetical protein [Priestia megaterium]